MLLRRALVHRKSCKFTSVFVTLLPQLPSRRYFSNNSGTYDDNATITLENTQSNLEQVHYRKRESSQIEQHDQFTYQIAEEHQNAETEHNKEQTIFVDDEENASDNSTSASRKRKTVTSTMELAAKARRDIFDLWKAISAREMALLSSESTTTTTSSSSSPPFSSDQSAFTSERGVNDARDINNKGTAKDSTKGKDRITELDNDRICQVEEILHKYKLNVNTAREYDVSRGLGDAFERLLLLCVPLPTYSSSSSSSSSSESAKTRNDEPTAQLETVLELAGRNGRQLDVRTVQHLFARTNSFAEALAIFYSLRKCHFAMNMQAYHAMLYSLQRLEEEGWAQRFHEEYLSNNKRVLSEQALDFVLQGVSNQLLPENKPWLGRVMYAEGDSAAEKRQSMKEYDELGKMWLARYKNETEENIKLLSDKETVDL